MSRIVTSSFRALIILAIIFLAGQIPKTPMSPATVQAGNGTTIDIPQSNVVPVMDGICDPGEYSDAKQVNLYMSNTFSFPIFIKHSATDAYFCFGGPAGLPLPNWGLSHVVVYVDPLHDGDIYGSNADDFRVEMPYDPQDLPAANLWGTGLWNGSDPGGWQAVKYQTPEPSALWQVEFKISRETLGGWKRPVGIALFYHWWRFEGDDSSWPEYGIWANAKRYGNGNLNTGTIDIGNTATVNTMDGLCDNEYADASPVSFSTPNRIVTTYYELSSTDLYVCLKNLPIPAQNLQNQPNASVYLSQVGKGGGIHRQTILPSQFPTIAPSRLEAELMAVIPDLYLMAIKLFDQPIPGDGMLNFELIALS